MSSVTDLEKRSDTKNIEICGGNSGDYMYIVFRELRAPRVGKTFCHVPGHMTKWRNPERDQLPAGRVIAGEAALLQTTGLHEHIKI
jgi:hypothetical protein